MLFSFGAFSQSRSNGCNCILPITSYFNVAPMTQGPDIGIAPYYLNDNAATPGIALPFNFCFYGQNVDSVYISNNGIISFNHPIYNFLTAGGFPLGTDSMMIAPFYADVDNRNGGGPVYYEITPTYMVVRWDSVRYVGTDVDGSDNFQLIISDGNDPILPNGNNVSFCYGYVQWACADASGGYSGYDGIPAIVGINKGNGVDYAQLATFSVPGGVFYGPYDPYNGLDWLNFKSFMFNSCVSGNNIAPVAFNFKTSCNVIEGCPGDTFNVTTSFLCSGQGQTVTFSAGYSGPTSISVFDTTSNTNGIDSIVLQLIPAATDTGTYILTINATDNSLPPLISTLTYNVVVNNCYNLGIPEQEMNSGYSVYPNPANGNFTVEINNQETMGTVEAKVYDILGIETYSSELKSSKSIIDLSDKSKGMYFLKLFNNFSQVIVQKIIIQ
jgi:hypothetical protein